jgi:hypothetical protein
MPCCPSPPFRCSRSIGSMVCWSGVASPSMTLLTRYALHSHTVCLWVSSQPWLVLSVSAAAAVLHCQQPMRNPQLGSAGVFAVLDQQPSAAVVGVRSDRTARLHAKGK